MLHGWEWRDSMGQKETELDHRLKLMPLQLRVQERDHRPLYFGCLWELNKYQNMAMQLRILVEIVLSNQLFFAVQKLSSTYKGGFIS